MREYCFCHFNGYEVKDAKARAAAATAAKCYESYLQMSEDENIKEGTTVVTMGFYAEKDGGAGIYKIVSEETLFPLTNGLFADLISDRSNAKCYGIRGGGVENTNEAVDRLLSSVKYIQDNTGTIGLGTGTTIFFPNDIYRLPTITIAGHYITMDFNGSILNFGGADGIVINGGYKPVIRNAQFREAKNAIQINGSNLDNGELIIENCKFFHTTGTAIDIPMKKSYIATIRNCQFYLCNHVLESLDCDMMIMEKCWISEKPKSVNNDGSIILRTDVSNGGEIFTFRDNIVVPYPFVSGTNPTGTAQIVTYGVSVICENTRFGAENGSKPAVKIADATVAPNVYIRDCPVAYCANQAALVAVAGKFKTISVTNTYSWHDLMVPVGFASGFDSESYTFDSGSRIHINAVYGNLGLPKPSGEFRARRLLNAKFYPYLVAEDNIRFYKRNYSISGTTITGRDNAQYGEGYARRSEEELICFVGFRDYNTNRYHKRMVYISANVAGADIGYFCDSDIVKVESNTSDYNADTNITLSIDTEKYPTYTDLYITRVVSMQEWNGANINGSA